MCPAAKRLSELLVQGAPELIEVATKKVGQASVKRAVAKTARKQIGGSQQSRIRRGW